MNTSSHLEVQSLSCARGGRRLFEDLSFRAGAGSSLVISGENGSGKTTLLRILVGLIPPDSGSVRWNGEPLGEDYRRELRYVGHHSGLKDGLTAAENLRVSAALSGQPDADIGAVLDELGLGRYRDGTLLALSAGQRRRLALGRLLLGRARLWVLDEPFTALDDAGKRWIRERIDRHVAEGGITVVASHDPLRLAGPGSSRLILG